MQEEITRQAQAYARHQAAKSLPELAELMERTRDECARCLEDVTEAQAAFMRGDEWSIKQVLGHAIGSAKAVNREIENLAAGRPPSITAQTGIPAGGERSIEELRQAMDGLWAETMGLLASLPEDGNLDQKWEHPWFGPLNFKEWIAFQRMHTIDHVQQIEKMKSQPGYPGA